jgi:hypothetical protein
MDFNATVDLIIKDLEEAREIIDDLKNYPGVPVIQIEMAKSKCKSAGEIISLLKTIQNQEPVPNEKQSSSTETKTEVVPPEDITVSDVQEESSTPSPDKKADHSTVGDSFSPTDRLNEQIGSTRGEDNVTKMIKTKPLANLDDAIGVNDKFLFIREIFNGSPESYNQAIERLNGVKTFADARNVLMSYTDDNKETKIVKQFLDIVKRKFPSDE